MSSGERLPLDLARQAAGYLINCWVIEDHDVTVAGSVRRGKPDVGDLELVLPHSAPEQDQLYRTLVESKAPDEQAGLFGVPSDLPQIEPIRGLKPGFKACAVRAHIEYEGRPVAVPVEIYRFMPGARAWSIIMRTGPEDFGRWFLSRWKRQLNIPVERKASIDGCLVDPLGNPVHIDDERKAFSMCGIRYIAPEEREHYVSLLKGEGAIS